MGKTKGGNIPAKEKNGGRQEEPSWDQREGGKVPSRWLFKKEKCHANWRADLYKKGGEKENEPNSSKRHH